MQKATDIVSAYLPDLLPTDVSSSLLKRNRESCVMEILNMTQRLLDTGDPESAFNQFPVVRELTSGKVTKRLLKLLFRAGAMRLKHQMRRTQGEASILQQNL